jgi:3-oxoacyl-[acyl-carrier-protein] synthase II
MAQAEAVSPGSRQLGLLPFPRFKMAMKEVCFPVSKCARLPPGDNFAQHIMPNHTPPPVQTRRVVITGMSVATALGLTLEDFWSALIAGRSGISRIAWVPDDSPFPCKIAGCIADDALAAALGRLKLDDPDRGNQLALLAVGQALEDAGLPVDGQTEIPADVIFGTGHGNVAFNNEAAITYHSAGFRKVRPTTVVRIMFNRPANIASIRFRLIGGNFVLGCACATGLVTVGEAYQKIRLGMADCVVAACADTGLDAPTFAAWNRLGVLSRIPDPARASRPFDQDRDGIVMGEGAAGFVLESLASAQRRGARIHGEVLGLGTSSDAKHIVQPDQAGQVRALRQALASAGIAPGEVDYVNAHGTATDIGDVVEAATLREVFGPHAGQLPVSSTKGQLGHLMGATSGVELVATLLAMRHSLLPACQNLDHPDPRCAINLVRGQPLAREVRIAMKNAFAFGGANCSLVLGRWT